MRASAARVTFVSRSRPWRRKPRLTLSPGCFEATSRRRSDADVSRRPSNEVSTSPRSSPASWSGEP